MLFLNPPCCDGTVMVKEGRCMQRRGAWGYVMAPVTMVTMATMVRASGHEVSVLDGPAEGMSFDAMLEATDRLAPDLVVVNTSTPSISDDLAAAAAVKGRSGGHAVVALYGIHPTCEYTALLRPGAGVDCCVLGEPELTVHSLVEALTAGAPLSSIAGLAVLDEVGAVRITSPRAPIADLDALPIPDWSLVDTGRYRLPLNDRRFLLVNTNRGCPHRCTFCNAHAYYGRAPRRRSVAHVLAELQQDVTRFGVTDFMFWAEEFVLDREFVLALCDAIVRSGLEIRWVCNSRVDGVTREVLDALARAGCWNIAFGIESGDQRILDRTRKQTTIGQIRDAVAMAKAAGLQVTGHVIVGFPEDTRESIEETGRFVDALDLDFVQYYCAIPYPGTDLHREASERGWIVETDWKLWEHNRSVLSYPHLTAADVMKTRRRLMVRWYLRPATVLRTARKHLRRPSDVWTTVSKLGAFLRWM